MEKELAERIALLRRHRTVWWTVISRMKSERHSEQDYRMHLADCSLRLRKAVGQSTPVNPAFLTQAISVTSDPIRLKDCQRECLRC